MSSMTMNNLYVKTHNSFLPETARNLHLGERTENNNQITSTNGSDKTIHQVWSTYNFETNPTKIETVNNVKMSWATEQSAPIEKKLQEEVVDMEEPEEEVPPPVVIKEEPVSPSHHARRPMNAFLIFCKKHRPVVRNQFPNSENRAVTKILGEWWAQLNEDEKEPYTSLAKEYKDAFLAANPDFKWYKLPAPPLRNYIRPTGGVLKVASPISSPNHLGEPEFTPGKLADESQLGGLTSLLQDNFTPPKQTKSNETNNNVEKSDQQYDPSLISPVNLIKRTLPPKPFKKRSFEKYDNKLVARNILPEEPFTQQDLMEKVVDKIFVQEDSDYDPKIRKSGRQCKGKRYEKFMVEGRLLGNKKDTKLTSQRLENEFNFQTETPNLDHTIKRLAERTNMKNFIENQERVVENANEAPQKGSDFNCEFNLGTRISSLPSLSYEVYNQRKRESKNRKNPLRADKSKVRSVKDEGQLVGSKKRKNKRSITHLKDNLGADLIALETLAEVAANTQKIHDELL